MTTRRTNGGDAGISSSSSEYCERFDAVSIGVSAAVAGRFACFGTVLLALGVVHAAGCATPFGELPASQRKELCRFFQTRALQGDMLACGLEAQRMGTRLIDARKTPETPRINVVMNYDQTGFPTRVRTVEAGHGEAGKMAEKCFRSALSSLAIPPPGTRLTMPLVFLVATPDKTTLPVGNKMDRCSVHVGL